MRLYISSPQGTTANLARMLERVARLYRRGVIDDASTVWINADLRTPTFWILSWRPACILWIDASTSGTVRLTKDRIRWAPTFNASSSAPEIDVHLDSLPVDSIKHVTVIVDHGNPREPVQLADATAGSSASLSDGFHQGTQAAVIDLMNFVPPDPTTRPAAATYTTSLAFVHGMRLLTKGMGHKQAAEFEENIELHGVDVPPEFLSTMVQALSAIDTVADVLAEKVGAGVSLRAQTDQRPERACPQS